MNTHLRSFLFALLIPLLVFVSCRKDEPAPAEPDPPAVVPLDTTSHEFVWEFDTVAMQYSMIHGVAAVAEDDIWVSGQFFGHNPEWGTHDVFGNAAHWNGREWTMHGFNVLGDSLWYDLWDAKAFGPDNIWICGGSPFRWDGTQWKAYDYDGFVFRSGINDIWSSKDQKHVCAVGYKRSCVLYAPESDSFEWFDMPRDENLYDVTGTEDGTIYIAGGKPGMGHSYVYRIKPDRTVETWFRCPNGLMYNVWFLHDTVYVSCNEMIYRPDLEQPGVMWPIARASGKIYDVEMEASNNIIATTQYNTFLHYNGSTWKEISYPYPKVVTVTDLDIAGRHVYIVGYTPEQYCLVIHGTRL